MHKSFSHRFFSIAIIFTVILSAFTPPAVFAQEEDIRREINAESGKISFIGPAKGSVLPAERALDTKIIPQDPARALIKQFAHEFGIENPARDFSEIKSMTSDEGRISTRFQQYYQGIPIIAGELVVNTNKNGDLYSMNGEVSPSLSLPTKPMIDSAQAKETALIAIAKWYELSSNDFVATEPELWIFDESLLRPSTRPVELVWRLEVTGLDVGMPVRELVLVNAERGNISTHFNQIDTSWSGINGNEQETSTPTPPVPTETPEPSPEDSSSDEDSVSPTPTPTGDKPETSEEEQRAPMFPQAGVFFYVNIATGNNANSCTSPASPCKDIQETINKATSGDTIYVANGTYLFSTNGSQNVVIINGKNLNISGGWNSTFTSQNDVSIIDGANTNNGLLLISGTVTIENFIIQNSRSSNSGAIYTVNGNLTIRRSTLKNNLATGNGGGIFVDNGTITIINSTISGNTANGSGGGIYASNNTGSSVTIQNSTIANNTASSGGGINRANGTVNITNSILANNIATSSGPDCNGTITSAIYSIIENTTNCSINTASNNLNVDPQISSTLSGTFQVHTLQTGSPAINVGTNTGCPAIDQVGTSRPQGSTCDIGGWEYIIASPSIVKYEELIVDETRNRLYGADKIGNKIDVIDMDSLSIVYSYILANGAAPISIDLSPDGNELAIAQSGVSYVKFINLTNGTITENSAALSNSATKVTDVIYGRTGILYVLTNRGLHVINLSITPYTEDVSQFFSANIHETKFGILSSNKNTLYYAGTASNSADAVLLKFDVSVGFTKPTLVKSTSFYQTSSASPLGVRLSFIDAETLLTSAGYVYNLSNLTPKANNFQKFYPASALTGKNFYITAYDNTTITSDVLYFFDKESSYKVSSINTGVIGTLGAIATTSNGNTLFVSSTGGMSKFTIGSIPLGDPIGLPSSNHQYYDLAIDIPRGLVYGTDTSGRIDVIDLDTTNIIDSYLLPSGANPKGIDISPDGSELAIALNGLGKLLFINPETGAKIAEVHPKLANDTHFENNLPFDLIYGRNGRLYSNGNPGSGGTDYIHVIDTSTHTWVSRSVHPNSLRTGAEFSIKQDNNYLYANQTFSPNNIYIHNVQTDTVTRLYSGPHGPVAATRFTIVPDGSKIFTSNGQVWDSIMQSQLGTLSGAPGNLIEYIPNHNLVVLSTTAVGGDVVRFISPVNYQLLATYTPSPAGVINEMEVSPDGNKLVLNINNQIVVLNLNPSTPSSIAILNGSNQSVPPNTQFLQTLSVKVTNFLGQPLSGIPVTFTAPDSGASGTFVNTGINITVANTNSNGIAETSIFSANNEIGSYIVAASVDDSDISADFQLYNSLQQITTYTANNGNSLPGTFLCNQHVIPCTYGVTPHADKAHLYAISTYNLYFDIHQRNGIDNNHLPIISSVHYSSGYNNAFWNGSQMVYGDRYGYPLADDVVAHELTHGVTQSESNLFYYYQSGAINESFSDLWGEFEDQTNGQGNDAPSVKWLIGEDVSGLGAFRSMSNPPAYGDPDKMTSPLYYTQSGDNGGVHYNSGINNKAVYLMVDGGTFNGRTVTALGWDKTAKVYYEAQTNLLTSGSDYSDLYYALQQACTNLMGQHGITASDCVEVKGAIDAVEMNLQPVAGFNTDAPVCTYNTPVIKYSDDFESGLGDWTFTNSSAHTRWQLDSSFGPFAQSGQHSLYADDFPSSVTDATARWTSFVVPNNAYLHFAHAYDFEYGGGLAYYDGGVLEYSTNGGSTWVDAGSFMDHNGYDNTILNYIGNNPLEGRQGFVGSSHGYISTRLNLASLAGQTVHFRWRMGLDESVASLGWWVDNVKVYTCGAETTFADVPLNASGWSHIESIYTAGITGGCTTSPLNYCPNNTVNRAQMAIFLMRGIHGSAYAPPAATGTVFNDVPSNAFGAAFIEAFANQGITGGCGAGNYCPNNTVTRAQMAIFLLRAKYGSSYTPPTATGTMFADVPLSHPFATWIEQLASEGITGGCGGGNYCPNNSVTRAQMAIFIQRTFSLPLP